MLHDHTICSRKTHLDLGCVRAGHLQFAVESWGVAPFFGSGLLFDLVQTILTKLAPRQGFNTEGVPSGSTQTTDVDHLSVRPLLEEGQHTGRQKGRPNTVKNTADSGLRLTT